MELTSNSKSHCWHIENDDVKDLSDDKISDFMIATGFDRNRQIDWFVDNWKEALKVVGLVVYAKFSHEIGEEKKNHHIHIAVCFNEQVRFGSLKKVFPSAHFDMVLKKSFVGCVEYVGAAPDYIRKGGLNKGMPKGGETLSVDEMGLLDDVIGQGARTDISDVNAALYAIKEMIDEGVSSPLLLFQAHFSTMVRHYRGVERYLELVKEHRENRIKESLDKGI